MRTWELLKHTTVPRVVQHLLWEFEKHSAALFHHPPTFPCRQLKYLISIKVRERPWHSHEELQHQQQQSHDLSIHDSDLGYMI